ncbi:MAG: hypothetical protein AAF184_05835 [Pseudomonadota bacterium]
MKRLPLNGNAPVSLLPITLGALLTVTVAAVTAPTANADVPAHTVAFFDTSTCPTGWVEAEYAKGRLLVARAAGDEVGVQVGDPLTANEVRHHEHHYEIDIRLPPKSISAAAGSTSGGAKRGTYTLKGNTATESVDLPFVQLIACERADDGNNADALLPFQASFFNATSCPTGWTAFEAASGRFIVPLASAGNNLGAAGGQALASGEVPQHQHRLTGTISLEDRSYAAITGCCNNSLARKTDVGINGLSEGALASIPYVQLLMCLRSGPPAPAPLPSGMIGFFPVGEVGSCPTGWSVIDDSQAGRLMVGLPAGGSPGATFGGDALANQEVRLHTHAFSGAFEPDEYKPAVIRGCCGGGYAKHKTYAYDDHSLPSDARAPYLQMQACRKD